jgi:hypothetical protein
MCGMSLESVSHLFTAIDHVGIAVPDLDAAIAFYEQTYRVTDVEAVSAVLRERGLRLLYDEPRRGTSDSRINFIHPKDAGGVLVELVEPAASPA